LPSNSFKLGSVRLPDPPQRCRSRFARPCPRALAARGKAAASRGPGRRALPPARAAAPGFPTAMSVAVTNLTLYFYFNPFSEDEEQELSRVTVTRGSLLCQDRGVAPGGQVTGGVEGTRPLPRGTRGGLWPPPAPAWLSEQGRASLGRQDPGVCSPRRIPARRDPAPGRVGLSSDCRLGSFLVWLVRVLVWMCNFIIFFFLASSVPGLK